MSATNRGGERAELDAFFTPEPLAEAIVEVLKTDGYLCEGDRVLEPSIGLGAFVKFIGSEYTDEVHGCDRVLRKPLLELWEKSRYVGDLCEGDFLQYQEQPFCCIVGNPPLSEAQAHIEHGIELLEPHGSLAFLLRLNFLAGIERGAFYEAYPPDAVYVLDKRPSFAKVVHCTEKKCGWRVILPPMEKKPAKCPKCGAKTDCTGSDACEYGVFVWRKHPMRGHEPAIRWIKWAERYKRWAKKLRVEQKKMMEET